MAKKKFSIVIDEKLCKACELCINFCPTLVLHPGKSLSERGYEVTIFREEEDRVCIGCKRCEMVCPDFAIHMLKGELKSRDRNEMEVDEE